MVKYLIIGNGVAGYEAVKEIRKNDQEGSILMVSEESYLTYYRPRLSEYLSKDFINEDLLINDKSWYEERNIDVLLGKVVRKIDIENNKVILDNDDSIEYENLLIATGSRPFIPPLEGKSKNGVLALRTLDDLHYIKGYFEKCEDIVVIGGGLLGLEAAWNLNKLGKKVSVVEFESYLLPKQLDAEISKKLESNLIEEGIKVYIGTSADKIIGEEKVEGILINKDKTIKADGVLFSVGVRPNIDLVRDTQVKYNRGIIVDEHLRTNVENIYAAGDVIEKDGVVMGLWTCAKEQGKIAGANMSGNPMKYILQSPSTTLKLGKISLFSVGNIKEYDNIYEFKDDDKGIHKKLFITDGKITGGILFGDTKDMSKLKKAVFENISIETYLNK